MIWAWKDMALFTGAVYGIAWLVTRSKLLRRPRKAIAKVPFVGGLIQCIVCTAVWIGFAMMVILPWTSLFSAGFRVRNVADVVFLTGWVIGTTWGLGRLFGDAVIDDAEH